jgi:hypothetical protein
MTITENEIQTLTDEELQQAFTNASLTYFVHQDLCWQLMKEIVRRNEQVALAQKPLGTDSTTTVFTP